MNVPYPTFPVDQKTDGCIISPAILKPITVEIFPIFVDGNGKPELLRCSVFTNRFVGNLRAVWFGVVKTDDDQALLGVLIVKLVEGHCTGFAEGAGIEPPSE